MKTTEAIPDNTSDRDQQAARRARRLAAVARVFIIYGLLFGGGVVFTLPFIWMIGTSFKVDREMFSSRIRLLPMRPVPARLSPYLDTTYYTIPRDPAFRRVLPAIRTRLARIGLPLPPELHQRSDAADLVAAGIYGRLRQLLPTRTWKAPDKVLLAAVRQTVTPEMIAETTRKILRRLSFGTVRVRSFDLQEEDVTAGRPISAFWKITGNAPARLVDHSAGQTRFADLVYDFRGATADTIRLTADITLPFRADRLYRIQLFIRPDDSWHPLEFLLEKNGRLLQSKRPEYMGNFQWSSVTLQEYGPDDRSTKIRLWIPMLEKDRGPRYESRPDHVRLMVVMRRNSALGAWWAKCRRNYRGALDYIPFWRYTATSVFLVILNIIGNIFACSLVAYSFARLQWPGRNFSFALMLATMMIPPQVTMIPYFLIIRHLGWYNTLKPLWVVSFFGNAFNIFLLRQFMKGIPRDLEDAARIDGCNFLQVYWYVIMPLVKPTLACIAIFTFMGVWNDFMGPLIYLSDQRLYPLSLGLYAFNVQAGANYGMMMAGSLLMTLPVIAIFFFAQKYFIQGVTLTGMKG